MTDIILALDLGQSIDFCAAVAIKREWFKVGEVKDPDNAHLWHKMIWIARWPLQTPYPLVVEQTSAAYHRLENEYAKFGSKLIIDAGGPGRPVLDMFKRQRVRIRPIGIVITSGTQAHPQPDGTLTVPRNHLLAAVANVWAVGDFKYNPKLQHADEFKAEMANLKWKIDPKRGVTGYDLIEQNVHDDIAMAAGMAVYYSTEVLPRSYFDSKRDRGDVAPAYNPMAKAE